jgi:hypothetical protein
MSQILSELLATDRVIQINGVNLFVLQNINPNRRNVICNSIKFENYIKENNLSMKNPEHIILATKLIVNNYFDDLELVKIVGYY